MGRRVPLSLLFFSFKRWLIKRSFAHRLTKEKKDELDGTLLTAIILSSTDPLILELWAGEVKRPGVAHSSGSGWWKWSRLSFSWSRSPGKASVSLSEHFLTMSWRSICGSCRTIPFTIKLWFPLFRLIVMKGINPQMLTAFLFLHPLVRESVYRLIKSHALKLLPTIGWRMKRKWSRCQPPGDERLFKKEEMINGLTDWNLRERLFVLWYVAQVSILWSGS